MLNIKECAKSESKVENKIEAEQTCSSLDIICWHQVVFTSWFGYRHQYTPFSIVSKLFQGLQSSVSTTLKNVLLGCVMKN